MSNCKYKYMDMPLKKYCEDNGVSYEKIETRIKRLKRKDLNLTNDELVKAAIEGKAYKYYYHGVALKDYCYTYNLSYNLIKDRISHLKK